MNINRERFLSNLERVAAIGLLDEADRGGRDRRPFSAYDRQARSAFTQLAHHAGLTTHLDNAGNLSARLPCGPADGKTLLLGSHLDTVPHGGPYDGALGVMAALEVLTVVGENDLRLPFHLEVIDFTDEEGRFGDFFGSRAVAGAHTADTINLFLSRSAPYQADLDAMAEQLPAPLTRESISAAARDPATLAGYLELHIEQGPRLEHAGIPIGVVSAIFGRRSRMVTFRGRPDHAGTTPLSLRADALVAAAGFIAGAPALVSRDYPDAVVTCGGIDAAPGVYNVVPDSVTVLLEFRAATDKELVGIDAALGELATEITTAPDLAVEIVPTSQHPPTPMAPALQEAICAGVSGAGLSYMELPSGAGHDAQVMAGMTPSAMLFVPSIGGRSHCPEEMTTPDDLVAGAQALLAAALSYADRFRSL